MKVYYYDLKEKIDLKDPICACIGYFDGLHKGHQALITKTKDLARKYNSESTLITFYPDPKDIITKKRHRHIQAFSDRLKIAEKMGIDNCIVFAFDEDFSHLDEDAFFEKVLCSLPLKALVCGFDFHYAHKGRGDALKLKQKAADMFEVVIVDEVCYKGEKISSTAVRLSLEKGDVKLVNTLLGYTYFNKGEVVHGLKNGHRLGFPTANLKIDSEILCPKHGVYIGYAKVDAKIYKAMINIGNNPTIADNNGVTYEVNILDFDRCIYGENIIVYLCERIRDDRRFSSMEELREQLKKDQKQAMSQDDRDDFIL